MRRFLLLAVLALGLAAPARADEAAIRGVISSQIEAFLADDFATAFTYASPTIRDVFRTPENFGRMVRQGYPMVWRPEEVEFLGLERRDGRLWQDVLVRDADGALHVLEYRMIEGPQGWKIDAVRLRRAPAGMA
jgi:hypothetical protein